MLQVEATGIEGEDDEEEENSTGGEINPINEFYQE
jgi:hypothetical protein